MKRRLLKYVLVGLMLVGMAGFWAFSTFLFNPLEGAYGYDLSTLIPREVDFYAAKAGLRGDFDPLPRLAFADAFEENAGARALLETEAARELFERFDLDGVVTELEAELAKLPLRVDPLEVFGGKDLAVAGFFRGSELAAADWAVYGRANWLGKLALELARSGIADLSAQGITKTDLSAGFSLSGGPLERALYLTRVRDVIVVATTAELIAKVHELDSGRGEDSFGQSAKYADSIAGLEADELETYVDYRALSETLRLPGTWPDAQSANLGTAVAGRLFQSGSVRELMATVAFGNGLTFHLSGQLSSEYMSQVQKRLYRRHGLDKADILELARMAPADCGLFACGVAPIGEILRETMDVAEEAAITNLEDLVRSVWGYADLRPLIDELDACFKDRFAFFLRNDDYPLEYSDDAPLRDGKPVPAWAVVLIVDDNEAIEAIRQKIVANQAAFGIRGREPGRRGVFENTVAGGGKIYEYHNPLVDGTGHVATLEMAGPGSSTRYFVLSNSGHMLGQIFLTYRRGDQARLSEDSWVQTLVNTGLGSADLVLWFNPRAVAQTARAFSAFAAEQDVTLAIDWSVERPRLEREILQEHFPGQSKRTLDPGSRDGFEMLVDQAASRLEADHLPRLVREYARRVDAMELTRGTLLELAIDQKRFHLYGRVVIPLD